MKKKWIAVIGSAVMVIAVAGIIYADSDHAKIQNGTIIVGNHSENEFASMAKISTEEADKIALAKVKGQVIKTELEDEDGFLIYDVEVKTPDNTVMEVEVDAGSGKVLAVEKD